MPLLMQGRATTMLLDGIPFSPVEWTPAALVSLVILMILTGWLIPKFYYKELKADRDRLLALDVQNRETISNLVKGLSPMVESALTSEHLLSAIQQRASANQEEEPDVRNP